MTKHWIGIVALGLATALAACDDGAASSGPDATGGSDVGADGADAADTAQAASFGALDHVTGATYTGLLVEVDYVAGSGPRTAALDAVKARLASLEAGGYLDKPDGVRVVLDEELPAAEDGKVFTFDELDATAKAHRSLTPAAGESSIYILYTDGAYQDDGAQSYILGYAYGGSWMVMLADNVDRSCDSSSLLGIGPLSGFKEKVCATAEAAVLLHELGHLFGLVDNGLAMVADHEDAAHPAHDSNEECLMYWALEGSNAVDVVAERWQKGSEDVMPFDQACLDDMKAAVDAARSGR